MRILCSAALAATMLAGCAGRDAQQIATVQPQDTTSDCAMINAEIQANNKRAEDLANEKGLKVAQNVAAGVAGLVLWPVWFAMDAKGAAGTELDALKSRQEYLANLAATRCAVPPAAPPPAVTAAKPKRAPKPAPVAAAPHAAAVVEAVPKPGT
jgi:hypothetical protein